MAGNVREWCWNASGNDRYIMGRAWNEPAYMYNTGDAQFPFDRSPTNAFCCVRYLGTDAPPGKRGFVLCYSLSGITRRQSRFQTMFFASFKDSIRTIGLN